MFFVHIPKTSGSSWNAALKGVYGDNFLEHAEYRLPPLLRGDEEPPAVDCVTGHIPFNNWRNYPGNDAYDRMTVLRDPWARLVSHINWIDRFNNGHALDGYGAQVDALAAVAELIETTDFEDRASLARFREQIQGDTFHAAFNNFQVRMLTTCRGNSMLGPVSDEMLVKAIENVQAFDGLGICEDDGAFLADMMKALGETNPHEMPFENKGVTYRVHTGLDLAFDELYPLMAMDQVLYRRVRGFIAERRSAFGSAILPPDPAKYG